MKPKNSLKWSGIKLSGEWPIWPKPTATLENTKMYQNYFLNEIICLKWPNSAQFMETFNMFYVDITLWFWLRDIFIMQIRKWYKLGSLTSDYQSNQNYAIGIKNRIQTNGKD